MSIADSLLAEFEQECQTTRKFLERLPNDKTSWKPHKKSLSAGQLALHIAQVPGTVAEMAVPDQVDMSEVSAPSPDSPEAQTAQEVLDSLDVSIAKVKDILTTLDDAQMMKPWALVMEGEEILTIPRAAFLRSIMLNHWYHHRGQFGVYLRLMGCRVPSSYGPSGDEMPDFLQGKEMAAAV